MTPTFLSGIMRCVQFSRVLDFDYALYEYKPVNPSISTENHNEQLSWRNGKKNPTNLQN